MSKQTALAGFAPQKDRAAIDQFVAGPDTRSTGGRLSPDNQRMTIDVPKSLHKQLRLHALKNDVTLRELCLRLLESGLLEEDDSKHKTATQTTR